MKTGMKRVLKEHFFSYLTLICGTLAIILGMVALLGWLAELPILSSLGSGRMPMAPSSALLFMLYGSGIILLSRTSPGRAASRAALLIGVAGAAAVVLLLIFSSLNMHPEAEHLCFRIGGSLYGAPIGHMSPVTALCFALIGLSYLASLASVNGRTRPAALAFWPALLAVLFSFVLLLAYLLGSPFLYGSRVIPPALPTSLASLFLGTALLSYSWKRIRPDGKLSDMVSTRSEYVLIMIFVLLVAGIVTAGYLYLRNYEKEHRVGVEQQLSSVAELKVNDLAQYRRERLGDASILYKNSHFSDMVRHFLTNPDDAAGRRWVHGWLKKIQAHYQYDQVRLLDTRGVTRLSEPAGLAPSSIVITRRVSDVVRTREIAFQDFYFNEYDHRPYLSLLVPILDDHDGKRAIGVVTLRIDPETYLYPFISFWPSASRTAETLIIRREGNDALFLNELRFRKNTALKLRMPLERSEVIAVQAALGREGIVEGVDYQGVPVLANVRVVPDSPWVLIARMNIKEIYAPLRERLWMIIALVGSLLIGAGSGVALIWRQQHVRFYHERYEAAEALLKSEEWFRTLFEKASDGILYLSLEGGIVSVNESFARMHGYGVEEVMKMNLKDLDTPESIRPFPERMRRILAGETLTFEVEHYHKNVTTFPLEVTASLITVGGKKFILAFHRDITDRRRLEDQLRQAQKMEAIGTLAGGIAHDFNNILSAIIGYGHITLMKMQQDDPQRLNVEHIMEAADRAAQLTRSLLAFSRKQAMDRKPLDLCMVLRNVEKFLKRVIGEDIEVRMIFNHCAPPVDTAGLEGIAIFADAGQLEQVFMNLATNARDAMPNGGSLAIETTMTELDDGFIAAHGFGKPGNYAMIMVTDTGIGMDEETRKRIFDPFFTTKEVGKGTGLGLAMVYGIIKQHDGFINVYSEPGKGTTFRIYLPAIKSSAIEAMKAAAPELPLGGTETVLVAEDDPTLQKLTRVVLEGAGYTVIVANDGEDAVKKFIENKDRIELLLFDLVMPRKSGKEAADEIRSIKPGVRVLFASGYAPDLLRKRVMLEDTASVVFKPLRPTDLLRKVREILDR